MGRPARGDPLVCERVRDGRARFRRREQRAEDEAARRRLEYAEYRNCRWRSRTACARWAASAAPRERTNATCAGRQAYCSSYRPSQTVVELVVAEHHLERDRARAPRVRLAPVVRQLESAARASPGAGRGRAPGRPRDAPAAEHSGA